jgi:hypothetical protein
LSITAQKIVALNEYCRDGQPLRASVGHTFKAFDRTVSAVKRHAAVLATGHDEDEFSVEWHPRRFGVLLAIEEGFASSTQFELEIPLEGEVADVMLADIMRLAHGKMVEDIRREQEVGIAARATARMQEYLRAVERLAEEE